MQMLTLTASVNEPYECDKMTCISIIVATLLGNKPFEVIRFDLSISASNTKVAQCKRIDKEYRGR